MLVVIVTWNASQASSEGGAPASPPVVFVAFVIFVAFHAQAGDGTVRGGAAIELETSEAAGGDVNIKIY